jgi:hypothetical protein
MMAVGVVPYKVSSFDANINNDDGDGLMPVVFFSR